MLLAIAAPIELEAVCRGLGAASSGWTEWECRPLIPGIDAVLTGIGKSNAAGAVARAARAEHVAILSLGIAGVLPPRNFAPGQCVLSRQSVFADEGVDAGTRFLSTADIGFPMPGVGELELRPSRDLINILRPLVDLEAVIATVSTCSGTDDRAIQVSERTGAEFEAMEGAAVGLVAFRLGRQFAEVRIASNTAGERSRQRWELAAALGSLTQFSAALMASLTR